jgi:hypothetical protein
MVAACLLLLGCSLGLRFLLLFLEIALQRRLVGGREFEWIWI